mmetsp:Transcript_12611/g.34971  ORF Transcript_12611/g.34971 Transcript_12611/m.34971 type:complete len:582 (-) Transcript_12611:6987-8732(-)
MRYDLAFILCCCKSFLGEDSDGEDFYSILGVDRDASQDEIKRAYKKQSLLMHPDKLAQKGKTVTDEDQAKFTRMKEAYEVLSDPHKRETFDAVGERGMRWMEEPFSIDPQELAHNFATSSVLDRSKIFSIFVFGAVSVLILPFLVCLHVDGVFGPGASWFATLIPLWFWNTFILFYHVRVILMGPIQKPDHVADQDWQDPLPMKKRYFSLARFLLIVLFELLVAMKLDLIVSIPWSIIFFPLYIWEATTLYKKWPLARMRIVTVEDLEQALGKPFTQFTQPEKDLIGKRYNVVPHLNSPEFEAAQKLKVRARHDIIKSLFRVVFVIVLLIQLDGRFDWNWWIVFSPFWVMTILICFANYQAFAEVQENALKKDPNLFNPNNGGDVENGYGAVGEDGKTPQQSNLTEEEKEELRAQVMAGSSRLGSKCCSQGFLLFIVIVFVSKLQGGSFSSLWIISPFLFIAGIVLCCLGCAIFGIQEVPTDGVEFDTAEFGYGGGTSATEMPPARSSVHYAPPPAATPSPVIVMPPPPSSSEPEAQQPSKSTIPVPVAAPAPQPVDLLDNNTSSTRDRTSADEEQIGELD